MRYKLEHYYWKRMSGGGVKIVLQLVLQQLLKESCINSLNSHFRSLEPKLPSCIPAMHYMLPLPKLGITPLTSL